MVGWVDPAETETEQGVMYKSREGQYKEEWL